MAAEASAHAGADDRWDDPFLAPASPPRMPDAVVLAQSQQFPPIGADEPSEYDDTPEVATPGVAERPKGCSALDHLIGVCPEVIEALSLDRESSVARSGSEEAPLLPAQWQVTLPGGRVIGMRQYQFLLQERQGRLQAVKDEAHRLERDFFRLTEGHDRRTSLRGLDEISAYTTARGNRVGEKLMRNVGLLQQVLAEQWFQLDQRYPRIGTSESAAIETYHLQSAAYKSAMALQDGYRGLIALAGPDEVSARANEDICYDIAAVVEQWFESPKDAEWDPYGQQIKSLRRQLAPLAADDDACHDILAIVDGTQRSEKRYPVPSEIWIYQLPKPNPHAPVTAPTPGLVAKWKGQEVAGYGEVVASLIGPGKGADHCKIFAIELGWRSHPDGRGGFVERVIKKEDVLKASRGYCKQWWD